MPASPGTKPTGARKLAYDALLLADRSMRVNDALHGLLADSDLAGRDRRFATELVLGTTRLKGILDRDLADCYHGKFGKIEPQVRRLLRMGAYQMRYMDKVPPYAAIDSTVDLAVRQDLARAKGLINGVLRELSRRPRQGNPPDDAPVDVLAAGYSHPQWLVEKWLDQWDRPTVIQLLQYNNRTPEIWFRRRENPQLSERLEQLIKELNLEIHNHPELPEYFSCDTPARLLDQKVLEEGLFIVQNPASGAVVRMASPKAGETIIDLCAGPGGKTAALSDAVGPEGRIIACEIDPKRADLIGETVHRLSLANVEIVVGDALQNRLPEAHKILVDAPCTGTGVLARRADLRWRRQPEHIAELAALQKALAARAIQLLHTGGKLIYATCSLEPEENWEIGDSIMEGHPGLGIAPETGTLPPDWLDERGALNTLPWKHNIDGMFSINLTLQ
ncbi:MAG: 16S rRNA (cytosine(967)-C(5))-methyltransferase RsmB [Candidatus Marinimicrobia bacterium]|nr:16S rRNA (cytosine(967)-C(5))-methyltransferase RsmB [Candidatus Neomarinimicrobiota bacterium]